MKKAKGMDIVMNKLVYSCLMPHPPIVLPEVGGKETEKCGKTVQGMTKAAERLVEKDPDTIVIITSHGAVFQDAVAISAVDQLIGDMGSFRAPSVQFKYENNLEFVNNLHNNCQSSGISTVLMDEELIHQYNVETKLDHGVMVPIYYLEKAGFSGSLVVVAMGLLPNLDLYAFGTVLQQTITTFGDKIAVVASGDMSHRLTPDAPAGYNPKGQEFDQALHQAIEDGQVEEIVCVPHDLAEEAGECGLRPLIMLLGCMDGYALQSKVLSYEGPFGVGYMIAEILPEGSKGESLLPVLKDNFHRSVSNSRNDEHALVQLARETLEAFVTHGKVIEPDYNLPDDLPNQAGVFVSLKKHGQLRGCIGTTEPTTGLLAEEVMRNAISAGMKDPRFSEVTGDELGDITYSVDVLYPSESIKDQSNLDPKKYGVIVSHGHKTGLLLPNLEGVDTVEEQLNIALRKAGIGPGENYQLRRFRVDRYH